MCQHNAFKTNTKTRFLLFIFMFTCLILSSCADNPLQPVSSEEEQRIKAELDDRSFRQFDPSKDADKRKGVIINFFDGVGLWAQYAEGMYALNEWEILSDDYRIEKAGSEYRIYFEAPRSVRTLPTQCDNCIETTGISISIQNLCQLLKPKDLGLLRASNNESCMAPCKPASRASFLFLVS